MRLTCTSKLKLWKDNVYLQKKNFSLQFKNGPVILCRPRRKGVVSDADIVKEVIIKDEYKVKVLPQLNTVIDIGGQIGSFSCLIASKAKRVLTFEPVKENFVMLKKNIAKNMFSNIKAEQLAVTGNKNILEINFDAENNGGHSSIKKGSKVLKVKAKQLRDILKPFRTVDIVKMDCEGGEFDIILNTPLKDLQKIKRIFLELHQPIGIDVPLKKLHKKLKKAGFIEKEVNKYSYANEGTFWLIDCKLRK